MKMLPIVIVSAAFGFLLVEIIEFLEKCQDLHAAAEQEARRPYQLGP